MRHFFAAADMGEMIMDAGEVTQCAAGFASCYSYEDLPSNRFGGESSNALKETVILSIDAPPSEDRGTVDVAMARFREGGNLFNALGNVFAKAGATTPEAAANYNNLPTRERQKVPDGYWTPGAGGERRFEPYSRQEKAGLIQTGRYVPQNFSDRKMDLTNFPKPAERY